VLGEDNATPRTLVLLAALVGMLEALELNVELLAPAMRVACPLRQRNILQPKLRLRLCCKSTEHEHPQNAARRFSISSPVTRWMCDPIYRVLQAIYPSSRLAV
jgi:hypothetical protein